MHLFELQLEYATYSNVLVSYLLAYEMWLVQHVDVTWVSHTLKHGNVVSIT
jgi:hypothetical protein